MTWTARGLLPLLGLVLAGCQTAGTTSNLGGTQGTRGPFVAQTPYPAFVGLGSGDLGAAPGSASESSFGPEPLQSFMPEGSAAAGAEPREAQVPAAPPDPPTGTGTRPVAFNTPGPLAPPVRPPSDAEPVVLPAPKTLEEWTARIPDPKRRTFVKAAVHVALEDPVTAIDLLQQIPDKDRDLFVRSLLMALRSRLGDNAGAEGTLQQIQQSLDRALPLEIRRLSFCERVDGFGKTAPFPRGELKAGGAALLYFEPVHLAQAAEPDGTFAIRLTADCRVFTRPAGGGAERQEVTWDSLRQQSYEDTNANYRRDLWLRMRLEFPRTLPPGSYTLELTLEDREGKKNVTAALPFELR